MMVSRKSPLNISATTDELITVSLNICMSMFSRRALERCSELRGQQTGIREGREGMSGRGVPEGTSSSQDSKRPWSLEESGKAPII